MAENFVDCEHLRYMHGYDDVTPVGSISIEGAYLRSAFEFRRARTVLGMEMAYEVSTIVHVHGLGYSFVEIHEKTIDLRARYWVLATPVDRERVELVLVNQVRQMRNPGRPLMGLRFLPMNVRHSVMNQILLSQQKRDVQQDVVIWEPLRYRHQPRLCQSDGPVGTYRRYCRQFYPDLAKAGAG